MDTNTPVIKLCIAGTRAEFLRQIDVARDFYRQAWDAAQDDYEACIAAHYLARHQEDSRQTLHWNQVALARAQAAGDARVESFYPSLYLNLAASHETLGNQAEAQRYYQMAADMGFKHQP